MLQGIIQSLEVPCSIGVGTYLHELYADLYLRRVYFIECLGGLDDNLFWGQGVLVGFGKRSVNYVPWILSTTLTWNAIG